MTKLSPQQTAFIDYLRDESGSVVLEAVAGSGKTFSLMKGVEVIDGQTALVAFNKAIATELKSRLERMGIGFRQAQAGTAHSFGFSAVRKAFGNVQVSARKVDTIVDELFAGDDKLALIKDAVITLVDLAKQRAIGVNTRMTDLDAWYDLIDHFDVDIPGEDDTNMDLVVKKAQDVLRRSNRITTTIDFNDMVYLPLIHNLRMWQFDNVMVDEAQDTNEARRLLYRKMLKSNGRMIAVGDPHQAIYGFTGADADSLDRIREDYNAVTLPLSVTFRCPKAVVEFAQQWVQHIEAAETSEEGMVRGARLTDLFTPGYLLPTDAILCRNTAPLVKTAFALIRNKIACRVEGREIGSGLIKLAQKWKITTIAALDNKLSAYEEREVKKAIKKKQESKAQAVSDIVATLRVVMEEATLAGESSIADVVARIEAIFDNDVKGVVTLSTIHKSKGREWPRVFWLDRERTCPSPWAKRQWQLEQEFNLCYVAATRAERVLVDVVDDTKED